MVGANIVDALASFEPLKEALLYEREEEDAITRNPLPVLHENTVWSRCSKILIQRIGFSVQANRVDRGRCPSCHTAVHGVWDGEIARPVTQTPTN